jgi:hypothetical protein
MLPIGGQALGRPVRGEGDGRLPLPVHALPAYFGKLGMADLLRDRPERCASPDRLQLFMVAYKDDLRPARLGLANEPGELAAPDHARLVDHEHVAAAECMRSPRGFSQPRDHDARVRLWMPEDSSKPSAAFPDKAAPWT